MWQKCFFVSVLYQEMEEQQLQHQPSKEVRAHNSRQGWPHSKTWAVRQRETRPTEATACFANVLCQCVSSTPLLCNFLSHLKVSSGSETESPHSKTWAVRQWKPTEDFPAFQTKLSTQINCYANCAN